VERDARALIGYLPEQQAIQLLHGAPTTPPDASSLARRWSAARDLIENRPAYVSASPIADMPAEGRSLAERVAQRQDIRALMGNVEWSVQFVDLTQPILCYQPILVSEDAEQRVAVGASGKINDLFDICLPGTAEQPILTAFDPSQNTFTATSMNPNLRIGGFMTTEVPSGASAAMKAVGFNLSFGAPFAQVARYQGRWMVRDGHHRLYGLLKLGITKVPVLVVAARTLEETGAGRPGFFGYELLFGERPPLFSDFTSDRFSSAVRVQATRKIIRVRAEEFAVPI
jgi:hypothetical protein